MPSNNTHSATHKTDNAVEKYESKTIDGCSTCPPKQACEGAEITIETSGCIDGGGSFSLRQVEDQIIPLHVECPGDGKLKITTCESLNGGGEFTANQECNTDIELCINNTWLDRFVAQRIGNGKFIITNDGTIDCEAEFTANQVNDTSMVLSVNWSSFPGCSEGGLKWNEAGQCWQVDWSKADPGIQPAARLASDDERRIAALEAKVEFLIGQIARLSQ